MHSTYYVQLYAGGDYDDFTHPVASPRWSEGPPATQCDITTPLYIPIHSSSHSEVTDCVYIHNLDPLALKLPWALSKPQHTLCIHSCFPVDSTRVLGAIWISHMHFIAFVCGISFICVLEHKYHRKDKSNFLGHLSDLRICKESWIRLKWWLQNYWVWSS